MSDIELKPCPFCGGEPEFDKEPDQLAGTEFDVIQCKNCATQTALWNSKKNAAIAWNTRPDYQRVVATPDELNRLFADTQPENYHEVLEILATHGYAILKAEAGE